MVRPNYYFRTFTVLAAVAAAGLLMLLVMARPAHAAIITVNSTGDQNDLDFPSGTFDGSSDGHCDVSSTAGDQCTLRAAIQHANVTAGTDTINFNISGSGVQTIGVVGNATTGALPKITTPMTIDGFSQPGAAAGSPLIELDGTNAGPGIPLEGGAHGLDISGTSSVAVKGLVINNFTGSGVLIVGVAGTGGASNRVEGNFIGTDPNGTTSQPNDGNGVRIIGTAHDNTVGGDEAAERNIIAFNGGDGVVVSGSGGNRIEGNSIFSNGGLGIDLVGDADPANGVTANDPKDPDGGPNRLQNFPVLSSATSFTDGTSTIKGTLNSTPKKVFTIQFFSSPEGDQSGFGEGEKFLGELNVRTSSRGKASFTFVTLQPVAAGDVVTATAIAFGTNDTSEFSKIRTVVQGA